MKEQEILKYKQMIDAGLDYLIESMQQKSAVSLNATPDQATVAMIEGFKQVKAEAKSINGLTKLKSWFKYISEWPIEVGDVNYQVYIKSRTGHEPDLFGSLERRVEKIIKAGIVTTENQYRDVQLLLNLFFGLNPEDSRVPKLAALLFTYKKRPKRLN